MPVFIVACPMARLRGRPNMPWLPVATEIAAPDAGMALDEFNIMYDRSAPCVAQEKDMIPQAVLVCDESVIYERKRDTLVSDAAAEDESAPTAEDIGDGEAVKERFLFGRDLGGEGG